MHLEQGKKEVFLQFKRGVSLTETFVIAQGNEYRTQCSFIQHYACVQEATDILSTNINKMSMKKQVSLTNEVDYIDQFLWNNPPNEDSDSLLHSIPNASTLMQKQFFTSPEQPSRQNLIKQSAQSIVIEAPQEIKKDTGSLELSKDYRKNLAGYIVKKVLRMFLSPSFSNKLKKLCARSSVNVDNFLRYLQSVLPKVFGPNSIHQLFCWRGQEEKAMKEMLLGMVQRTLRKRYTLEILREGRMRDYKEYVSVKNKGLLYFSQLLQ